MLQVRRARPVLRPLSLALLSVFATPAWAEGRMLLAADIGDRPPPKPPVLLDADRIDGRTDTTVSAQGTVRMERGETVLTADSLKLDQVLNEVTAEGEVEVRRRGDVIRGPRLRLNLDTTEGSFTSPTYTVRSFATQGRSLPPGSGQADELRFEGENQYRLFNATYSTCPAPSPDWYLRTSELELDFDRDKGTASHAALVFKDVPVAYLPWVQFPLSGGRQSGFLPPTLGSSTNTGVDFSLPYYFNLAPNYDATLAPRWMGRRGLQLGGEFRYLTERSNGRLQGEALPKDEVTGQSRWLAALRHGHEFGSGWSASVDASEVSDKDYFADLSTRVTATSQSTLNQQFNLNYSSGRWLTASLLAQRHQVLSGATPYSRMPQLTARVSQPEWGPFALQIPGELSVFRHPTQDEGERSLFYPQLSLPLESPGAYLTPKLGMHLTHYRIDRKTTAGRSVANRTVPIFSVDSGLNFERDTTFGKTPYVQTLEPRLYYVRASRREQSDLPVFDSALADFNFSQLFSENIFTGGDRVVDADQVTIGATSRFIERDSGVEWLRMAMAQRFHFSQQTVTLPGVAPREGSVADWLAGVSGRVHEKVTLDSLLQYDSREDRSERASFSVRYQPAHATVISASWRYKRGEFRDLDITTQWPLGGNWYGVARYNRSLRDHRLTEAIGGFEYKGDCWVLRTVFQSLINTKQEHNNSVFVQLEFNGLASIGSSPVQLLRRSIGGYGNINESTAGDPVFGGR